MQWWWHHLLALGGFGRKERGKEQRGKVFHFMARIWRGVVALFLDLLHSSQKSSHPHQSHSHQLPAQSFSLGRFVIFWHSAVCTTSIIRYDINTEYTSQVSSTRTCNTALQHQIVYLNELLIPTWHSSTRTCNTALQHQIVYLNELLIPTWHHERS